MPNGETPPGHRHSKYFFSSRSVTYRPIPLTRRSSIDSVRVESRSPSLPSFLHRKELPWLPLPKSPPIVSTRKKSTGPRTAEGKAASSFNALKHGVDAASIVIPGEDPAAYEALATDYYRQFQPQSAVEHFHVDTLIRSDWQKRRLQRVEAKLYRALLAEGATPEDLEIAILRDSPTARLLHKVTARIASFERAYFRALNDLRRIERERCEEADAGRQARQSASFRARIKQRLESEGLPLFNLDAPELIDEWLEADEAA